MIRSNGMKLFSSHLLSNACKSIYEGMFHRTSDSRIWSISRIIGGEGGGLQSVNLNKRMLPNTLIRCSEKSYTEYSYDMSNSYEKIPFTEFCEGFEIWCKDNSQTFSSEEDKCNKFQWFLHRYPFNYPFVRRPRGLSTRVATREEKMIFDCVNRHHLSYYPNWVTPALFKMLRQNRAYKKNDMKYKDVERFVLSQSKIHNLSDFEPNQDSE